MRWKTIDDFPLYEVSDQGGRVRNKQTGRECKKWIHNGRRYSCYRVTIYRNGKKFNLRVGRLVAAAFVYNSDPVNNTQVDHNDSDPFNDDFYNLEWVTNAENQRRKFKLKRLKAA